MSRTYLVTGAAGFIGSHLVDELLTRDQNCQVVSLDALTYAGNRNNLPDACKRHVFVQGDICNEGVVRTVLDSWCPDIIFNLAAESHVDRSLVSGLPFVQTNIGGVVNLLECARKSWGAEVSNHLFIQVSTDEVYGSLPLSSASTFAEASPLNPSSPYSASKASADLLVKAYAKSHGLPVVIVRGSNNYGPRQHSEKLVPLVISHALAGRQIPLYGNGTGVRDWLFVDDFCHALYLASRYGEQGETYNISANCELTNLDLARRLLAEVERQAGQSGLERLITFVDNRPGHDERYGMNAQKARCKLHWSPRVTLEDGVSDTVAWYLIRHDGPCDAF